MKPFISNLLGTHSKRACNGKRPHSRSFAEHVALSMARKLHEPFQAYRCRHCEFWHVGHPLFWKWSGARKRKKGLMV
jgi:hypothetical protein